MKIAAGALPRSLAPSGRTVGSRFAELDGLRGIAALWVVLYHYTFGVQYLWPHSAPDHGFRFCGFEMWTALPSVLDISRLDFAGGNCLSIAGATAHFHADRGESNHGPRISRIWFCRWRLLVAHIRDWFLLIFRSRIFLRRSPHHLYNPTNDLLYFAAHS